MSTVAASPAPSAPTPRPRSRLWRIVRRVLYGFVVLLILLTGLVAYAWYTAPVDTVGRVRFEQPLVIPPLAESHVDDEGRRVFDLTAQKGRTELEPGSRTESWGYNGDYLGPTLRAERGEDVVVKVTNDLDEATTVHWHGMHLPAQMDGGPQQPIEPGDTWSPTWRIDQPAATLWYHPHPHGETEDHIYRGLAGMFILDDPAPRGVRVAAARVRRRRHPRRRAGQAPRRRPADVRAAAVRERRSAGRHDRRQRHVRPILRRDDRAGPAAAAQRVDRAGL